MDFQTKLKEGKSNLDTSDDVRLLKGKVARKDKEIADIRKKTEISQKNFKSLKDQVDKLTARLAQIKERNIEKQKTLNKLTLQKNETTS